VSVSVSVSVWVCGGLCKLIRCVNIHPACVCVCVCACACVCVCVLADVVVGYDALPRLSTHPLATIFNSKRFIGRR
jgi:hypothetical protein